MFDRLFSFAQEFSKTNPTTPIDGDYYELPGVTVYTTSTHPLPERGRVEVNTLDPAAPESFAWQYEVTINDKSSGTYIHLLLRRDGSVVETYGKTVLDVSEERAEEILRLAEQLTQTTV